MGPTHPTHPHNHLDRDGHSSNLTLGDSNRHPLSEMTRRSAGGSNPTSNSGGAAAASPAAAGASSVARRGSTGVGGGAASDAAAASFISTPEKRASAASLLEKWTTPTKTIYRPLEPPLSCNRPKCGKNLWVFIPPGTDPERGVRFAACEDTNCAGGGTILTNDTKCFTCYRVIPVGTPCPSLRVEDKSE